MDKIISMVLPYFFAAGYIEEGPESRTGFLTPSGKKALALSGGPTLYKCTMQWYLSLTAMNFTCYCIGW
jgi:hypothetical protein